MAIDSSDTFIDPRDVDTEADEFESDIDALKDEIIELQDELEDEDAVDEQVEIEGNIENKQAELAALEEEAEDIIELRDDCDNYAAGESLINQDYWSTYVQQMAEDIDGINTSNWPYNCIDWDQAADDLLVDYTTITFRGQDFYVRA